jgi:hypothetical protein
MFEEEVDQALAELQGQDRDLLLRVGGAIAEEDAPLDGAPPPEGVVDLVRNARRDVCWVKLFGPSRLDLIADTSTRSVTRSTWSHRCSLSFLGFDDASNRMRSGCWPATSASPPTGSRPGSPIQVARPLLKVDHVHHLCPYVTRLVRLVRYRQAW